MLEFRCYITIQALIFKKFKCRSCKIVGMYNQFSVFIFVQVIIPIKKIFRKSIII